MAQEGLWGWDADAEEWVKVLVNSDGKLIIDPTEIFEDVPTDGETGKAPTSNWAHDEAVARAAADLLRLLLTGGTLTGPLIIDDATHIQLGDTAGQLRLIPGAVAAGWASLILTPGAGNRYMALLLQPKGTEDRSQLSLFNRGVGLGSDYSVFNIEVNGDTVFIGYEDVGTPLTSIAHMTLRRPIETDHVIPAADRIRNLGSAALRYGVVHALNHQLTQAFAGDHRLSGITAPMTAGTALTRTQAVYVGADGKMELAKADAAATMPAIALCAKATIDEDEEDDFLLEGFYRDDTWDWTPGGLLYIDPDTAGALTQTKPGAGEQAQPVGVAITADIIHFSPQGIEAAAGKTIATGTYTGDYSDERQITTGFKCSLVVIHNLDDGDALTLNPGCSISHKPSSPYHSVAAQAVVALHASDGFIVSGGSYEGNANGRAYHYWAISE